MKARKSKLAIELFEKDLIRTNDLKNTIVKLNNSNSLNANYFDSKDRYQISKITK